MEYLLAFLMGGVLSAGVQLLLDLTKMTPARILVAVVVAGVFLGAVGAYAPLREVFGAGVSVPLLGFGGNIAEGVRRAVDSEGFLGIFTGSLKAAAGGTGSALCFGYLAALIARSKPKRA